MNDIQKDLEETVLGALMSDSEALYHYLDLFDPELFGDPFNRIVAKSIHQLGEENHKIDMITVLNQVLKVNHINGYLPDEVTPAYQISSMASKVASTAHLEEHLLIIRQYSIKRHQIALANEILRKAEDHGTDALLTNEFIIDRSVELTELENIGQTETNLQTVTRVLKRIEAIERNEIPPGILTGVKELDRLTGGMRDGELTLLAARPGMGKTALALQIGEHAARTQGKHVAIFSFEMSKGQLITRMIASDCGQSVEKLLKGEVENRDEYLTSANRMTNEKMIIYDTKSKTANVRKLRMECKKLKAQGKLDMFIVDYLQLMDGEGRNREQIISDISRNVKLITTDLEIPGLALSQLNREVDKRQDKRPMLADLRESGSLEQDADLVMFIYRPEYYKIFEDENGDSLHQVAYGIIAKNRNGRIGDVRMKFIGKSTRFTDFNETGQEDLPF